MSREAFEAWYDRYFTEACEKFGGIDCSDPKGLAEDAWQAAQADAFERAARVCLDMSNERRRPLLSPYAAGIRNTRAAQCADAIRALAKEVTNA